MPRGELTRRALALAGLMTAGLGSGAFARQERAAFTTDDQRRGLLTVPVMINERGPYTFAIDSAANASVIASDLVAGLELADAGEVNMHTLIAVERTSTVHADRLRAGALDVRRPRLALTDRLGMSGLDGLLGTDLLANLRLVLNFRGRTRVNVSRPRHGGERDFDGERLNARATSGEQRFNGLLLIDAMAGAVPCKVIIDTGATTTVINTTLARAAEARPLILPDGQGETRVLSSTGRGAMAQAMLLPNLRLGGVHLSRVPVLVGDFHTFDLWGLADQPTMLLGVDLLGLFQTVIIDLKRGELLLDS